MRKLTTRTAAAALGSALALGATVVVAPAASASDDPTFLVDNCDLSRTIEQLQDYGSDTDSNVIVYRADKVGSATFDDIEREGEFGDVPCDDVFTRTYKWVIFNGGGDFVRTGDGGFRNWAYYGAVDRPSDEHLVFHPF